MSKRHTLTRERLDGTVIDIEFLLLAVIQGLALTTLVVDAENVIGEGQWLYWPYVISAFVLIINFWALATVHSISFISWPFDLVHTILYLLAAFVEVSAFAQVTHPERWFVFTFAFFVVSALLYVWDMRMIEVRRPDFQDTPARARLYDHIHDWQRSELRFVLPAALLFQGGVVGVLLLWPDLILGGNRHLYVVGAQIIFGLAYLGYTLRSFEARKRLISACAEV